VCFPRFKKRKAFSGGRLIMAVARGHTLRLEA
jgi:hypothetical protein